MHGDTTYSFGNRVNWSEFKSGYEFSITHQWDNGTSTTDYVNVSANLTSIPYAYAAATTGVIPTRKVAY